MRSKFFLIYLNYDFYLESPLRGEMQLSNLFHFLHFYVFFPDKLCRNYFRDYTGFKTRRYKDWIRNNYSIILIKFIK